MMFAMENKHVGCNVLPNSVRCDSKDMNKIYRMQKQPSLGALRSCQIIGVITLRTERNEMLRYKSNRLGHASSAHLV